MNCMLSQDYGVPCGERKTVRRNHPLRGFVSKMSRLSPSLRCGLVLWHSSLPGYYDISVKCRVIIFFFSYIVTCGTFGYLIVIRFLNRFYWVHISKYVPSNTHTANHVQDLDFCESTLNNNNNNSKCTAERANLTNGVNSVIRECEHQKSSCLLQQWEPPAGRLGGNPQKDLPFAINRSQWDDVELSSRESHRAAAPEGEVESEALGIRVEKYQTGLQWKKKKKKNNLSLEWVLHWDTDQIQWSLKQSTTKNLYKSEMTVFKNLNVLIFRKQKSKTGFLI